MNGAYGYNQAGIPLVPFTIKRMLMMVTRNGYQDVYQRTYNLNMNNKNFGKINELMHPLSQTTHTLGELEISTLIPDIINLNPAISGKAEIPNGWGTQRLRFMLEIEYNFVGNTMTSYIQGFSEYHDPTFNGNLDPNMLFYINSVTNLLRVVDPLTGVRTSRPHSCFNVITDMAGGRSYESLENSETMLVRPYDVLHSAYVNDRYSNGEVNVRSVIGNLGPNAPKMSKKSNNNPYKYFTGTINHFIDAKTTSEISHASDDILKNAQSLAQEHDISSNPLIVALNSLTGEFVPTKFTLNQLLLLDNTVKDRLTVINNNEFSHIHVLNQNNFLNSDVTESTLQPTASNIKTSMIASMVPGLMFDCFLTTAEFSLTNSSIEPVVIISNANSFILDDDVTLISYIEKFKQLIRLNLVPYLSDYGYTQYEVYISCDLIGDISIGMSINSSPVTIYRLPVFADSLYVPVIANTEQRNMVVNDFRTAFDATYSEVEVQQYEDMSNPIHTMPASWN